MALSSLLQYGRKRRRQYFPDNVPDTFPLTRGEIVDDIDQLNVVDDINQQPTQLPSSVPESNTQIIAGRPSKRFKLLKKVKAEMKTSEDLGGRQKELRAALDAIRADNSKLLLGIDEKNKELYRLTQERDRNKILHKTMQEQYKTKLDELNRDNQHHERMLRDLKQSVIGLTQRSTGFLREVSEINTIREKMLDFDQRYQELEVEFFDRDRRLKAAQDLFKQTSGPNFAPGRMEKWLALEDLQNQIKEMQKQVNEYELTKNKGDLSIKQLEADIEKNKASVSALEKENSELKARIQELSKISSDEEKKKEKMEIDPKVKKMIKDLEERVTFHQEVAKSKEQLVDIADQRTEFAEMNLRKTYQRMVTFKNGNLEQQAKFASLVAETDEFRLRLTTAEKKSREYKKDRNAAIEARQKLEARIIELESEIDTSASLVSMKTQELKLSKVRVTELETLLKDKETVITTCQEEILAKLTK